MISTYEAAKQYMDKARRPSNGLVMASNGWRLYQDGNEYVVNVRGVQIGRFLPDNTFMFTLTGGKAYSIAQTLGVTMNRNLPFEWKRCAKSTYRVDHRRNIGVSPWEHFETPTNAPQVYDGLRFDLTTGMCLNYKPDLVQRINPDRRKEWLAACKAWKRKVKVAARVGAFDALIRAEAADRTPWTERVRWNTTQGVDILYKAIKDNDCSVELMRMFVAGATAYSGGTTSESVYAYIEKLIDTNSIALRKRFGVFEGE